MLTLNNLAPSEGARKGKKTGWARTRQWQWKNCCTWVIKVHVHDLDTVQALVLKAARCHCIGVFPKEVLLISSKRVYNLNIS